MPRLYNATINMSIPAEIYTVRRAERDANVAKIEHFRPEGSAHRPRTTLRLWRDDENIFGKYDVSDQYVLSTRTGFTAEVWKDSCVECFLMPNARGYFNFEFNAGGHARASFIRDATRTPGGFKDFTLLPDAAMRSLEVRSSLPPRVEPEIDAAIAWSLFFKIPVTTLEPFSGPLRPLAGTSWRGNFYKCGDDTSHPHWASWQPVPELNFHLPDRFGTIFFQA